MNRPGPGGWRLVLTVALVVALSLPVPGRAQTAPDPTGAGGGPSTAGPSGDPTGAGSGAGSGTGSGATGSGAGTSGSGTDSRETDSVDRAGGRDRDRPRAGAAASSLRPPRDVARSADGRPEIVALGTPAETGRAVAALVAAGAVALRDRPLPALGRRAIVLVLPRGLDLGTARGIVTQAAPGVALDFHARYRFAQGGTPRLYAPDLVASTGPCRLRGRTAVGIIDGPVAADHPALARIALDRRSFLREGERAPPPDHGTAVAALIAGDAGAGALAGFAPGVRVVAVSAFSIERGREGADVDRIAAALDALLGQGVRIVNMSFAGPENDALAAVLAAAAGRGAVMIAATGNDGSTAAMLPAAAPGVIAVTAVDARGRLYRKANGGAHVEFAAPGVDLFAATARGGGYVTGTSYAAPIVTAFAARLAARGAGTTEAVRRALRAGAADLGTPGRDSRFGWGLVRAPGC